MYINIGKIIRIPVILTGLVIIGFGVYKFITAVNINQQIASTLVAIFGVQLMWFVLWFTQGKK
jgi:hypothetical protein